MFFLAGCLIVYAFTKAGKATKGPIETVFNELAVVVQTTETKLILKSKENTREKKLAWLKRNIKDLKNPKIFLTGSSDDNSPGAFDKIQKLEDSLNTVFPLIHIFSAWGSKDSQKFPLKEVYSIINLGSIPVITWEPWVTDFDAKQFPGIPAPEIRSKNSMFSISQKTYDSYIIEWAKEAKKVSKPLFLRFAEELNDPYRYPWGPQNNTAKDYVDAWKHVHDIFKNVGAPNGIWIWNPHPSYDYFEEYYPGDDYVDYVGAGVFNYGNAVSWSSWNSFKEIMSKNYETMKKFNKPIMITEFASLSYGGNRSLWYKEAFETMKKEYPEIKGLIFFHYKNDYTVSDKKINWYFIDDKKSLTAVKNGLKLMNVPMTN